MTTLTHALSSSRAGDHASDVPGQPAAAGSTPPAWLYVLVIIGALGVLSLSYSALFSPATILGAGEQISAAGRTWAHYAAAYNVALGVALLVPLAIGAWRVLAGTLVQAAFAEILLGVVGISNHRPDQVAADIVLIAAFLLCARRLHRMVNQASVR